MSESFDSLDVDRLTRLSEVHESLFPPEEGGSEEEHP
jgi:hypothetical protein